MGNFWRYFIGLHGIGAVEKRLRGFTNQLFYLLNCTSLDHYFDVPEKRGHKPERTCREGRKF
jgi:hypothetical protein